jgi:hypothetical protein
MAAGFIMQIFFLPETIYIRDTRAHPATISTSTPGKPTFWDRYGIHIPKRSEEKQHSFLFIATRPFVLFKYPAVILSAFWFGIAYMMHVGITAVIPLIFEAQYNFSVLGIGLSGFSGLIGALLGEAYAGPSLDLIAKRALKQGREWRPEYRLKAIWPALVTVPAGLIMFGTSIQFGKAWITPLIGQAVYIFGIEIATTVMYVPCFYYIVAQADSVSQSNLHPGMLPPPGRRGELSLQPHPQPVQLHKSVLSAADDRQPRSHLPICSLCCLDCVLLPFHGGCLDVAGQRHPG